MGLGNFTSQELDMLPHSFLCGFVVSANLRQTSTTIAQKHIKILVCTIDVCIYIYIHTHTCAATTQGAPLYLPRMGRDPAGRTGGPPRSLLLVMCVYIYIYICISIYIYIYIYICIYIHMCICAYMCIHNTYVYIYIYIYTHTHRDLSTRGVTWV